MTRHIHLGIAPIRPEGHRAIPVHIAGQREQVAVKPDPEQWFGHLGYFVPASTPQLDDMRHTYLAAKERGILRAPEGKFERLTTGDLAVDLRTMSPASRTALREEGLARASELYYFTSGAGLWSRGGGAIKALVPFNLRQTLGKSFAEIVAAGDVVKASSQEAVLKASGRVLRQGENIEFVARKLVADAKATIRRLLLKAQTSPAALNPLDIKFVNVAMLSARAKTYVPFDVWTSEQTHEPIHDYIQSLKQNLDTKRFHPKAETDAEIKRALRTYFAEAERRGDTHVFGYQVGYYAMDKETGEPLRDTALIGEGAGMAKAYLDASGRTEELRARGHKVMVFENIEVVTDMASALGAHRRAGSPISVMLVPQCEGYSGGSPFMVTPEGGRRGLQLHEMSALPAALADGNEFFNSNTILSDLALEAPHNVGFEFKERGTQVRAKMNAGDGTQVEHAMGIGGRIGPEYLNFKGFSDYGENGGDLIAHFRAMWTRDAAQLRQERGDAERPIAAGSLLSIRAGSARREDSP